MKPYLQSNCYLYIINFVENKETFLIKKIILLQKKSHVPKFGDWDSDESISYTACFETAQKNEGKGNPNDPEDNPEAFKGMLKSSAAQPPNSATSSSSKPRISSENVRQTEGDTSHGALRPNGVVHERRVSGGSFKSYRSESGSERSNSDYYLMQQQPRHRRARSERKSRLASSGSGRSHSIRSHSISNSPSKPKSTNSSTHQSSNLSQHDTVSYPSSCFCLIIA